VGVDVAVGEGEGVRVRVGVGEAVGVGEGVGVEVTEGAAAEVCLTRIPFFQRNPCLVFIQVKVLPLNC